MADDAQLDRARAELEAGDHDAARELVAAALREDPRDGVAHHLMAEVQLAVGDLAGAEASERLALDSGSAEIRPDALYRLSTILSLDPQRAREALAIADEAVRLALDEWRYRDQLAARLAAAGDFGHAIQQSEIAVGLAPDDPAQRAAALRGLAQVLSAAPGQQARAVQVAQQAVSTRPGMDEYQMLAATQLAAGHCGDVLRSIVVVLRSDPAAPLAVSVAGMALSALVARTMLFLWLVALGVLPLAFAVPGAFGVTLATGPAVIARFGACLGLAAFGLVGGRSLREVLRPSLLRPLWPVIRSWAWVWGTIACLGGALLCYLVALVLGIPDWLPMPFLMMMIARVVVGSGARRMRVPTPIEVLAPAPPR